MRIKKPERPALACRVDLDVSEFYRDLAIRRSEPISDVVERAILEYKKKIESVQKTYQEI